MNNVFSAEMYRIKKTTSTYVYMIVCIIGFVVAALYFKNSTMSYVLTTMHTTISIIILCFVTGVATDDYETKTMKNLLASGNSKKHIYLGKLKACFIVSYIYIIVSTIVGTIAGYLANGAGDNLSALQICESIVMQIVELMIIIAVLFAIASIIRSFKLGFVINFLVVFILPAALFAFKTNVLKLNIDICSIQALTNDITNISLSVTTIINFVIFAVIAIILNLIGLARLKAFED